MAQVDLPTDNSCLKVHKELQFCCVEFGLLTVFFMAMCFVLFVLHAICLQALGAVWFRAKGKLSNMPVIAGVTDWERSKQFLTVF